ncbi:S-layer homology domain-containing protein [Cohnella panacarvi]|uniref:S-layer homology domain-containing protein n=1 Tax=Cohnella panacarvi TaxID=400776 RepID=UPI00047BED73|nr:S-layer homology domain-containing protein [Cohnella panacarvi]
MKKRMLYLLLALLVSLPLPAAYAASEGAVSDVQGHWAEKQLEKWIGKEWIKGYGDGSFKPDGSITRAEFMALVNRSFELTDKSEMTVKDVKSNSWEYEQVSIAMHAGYISGYSDGTIRTGNKVTRQEAAVILTKLLKLDTSANADLSRFTDAARVPAWSKSMIGAVVARGIFNGYSNGTIGFDKALTRAETIVMLEGALNVKVSIAYDQAGIYGPATGHETIVGDVHLNASGVSLRNVTIKGDLTFGEGIGEGKAMILNVKVDGDTFIRGGGVNSIYIVGSTLGEVEVNKPSGDVRVAIDDQSKVNHITTYNNTTIDSTTAAQAKAAVAPQIAKEPEVKVLATPQKPIAPTTPPVGSKPEVWSEYFKQVTKYQEDLLAYALYISSLPNVTSAGSNTTTSVNGNVHNATNTGNNSRMNVTGSVENLENSGSNSQLNVGGGVGNLSITGSHSQTTITDFVSDVSVSGNNTQLRVGGTTGSLNVSGNHSNIQIDGPTGDVTIGGNDTQLQLNDTNNINLVGGNNTITSSGGIGNLTVGDNSLGNQLGLVGNANDIAKLTPLERAAKYSGISSSNLPNPVLVMPPPAPTTPPANTPLSLQDAKAVGAKKIEVKFNKSIDPASIRLSVSKNGSSIAFQAVPNSATNVYTLTLAEKLTNATYTVTASYTDSSTIGSARFTAENEKIVKIEYVTPSDTVAKGTRIGIEVSARNQYGESMPNLSGFAVSSTVPATIEPNRSIVVVDTSSGSLQSGISIIPITVTDTASQVTVAKNFRLGTAPTVSKAELRGSLRGTDGQEVSEADWSRTYHLNFDLYDQYGHMLLYPLTSGAGTISTTLTPNSASISVGALGAAPAGEPGTLSLPITLNTSGPEEGKDYTLTINVGGATASKTFQVSESPGPILATPTADPAGGAVASGTQVSLIATNGATIYYTTDGSTPTRTNGYVYSDPIVVNSALTVKAIAVQNGVSDSNVMEESYTIILTNSALDLINEAAASGDWTGISETTFADAGITGVTSEYLYGIQGILQDHDYPSAAVPKTAATIQSIVTETINLTLINNYFAYGYGTEPDRETFERADLDGVTDLNIADIVAYLQSQYGGGPGGGFPGGGSGGSLYSGSSKQDIQNAINDYLDSL